MDLQRQLVEHGASKNGADLDTASCARAGIEAMMEPTEGMIERVAGALAVADSKDPDLPAWVRFPGARPEGLCWRDQYSSKARAAIDAMITAALSDETG